MAIIGSGLMWFTVSVLAFTLWLSGGVAVDAGALVGKDGSSQTAPVVRIVAEWRATQETVVGQDARGFAGQIRFLDRNGETVPADGRVDIYVFDDQGAAEKHDKPLHIFCYPAESCRAQQTRELGPPAYSVFVPYTREGIRKADCRLRVRFRPTRGRGSVYSEAGRVDLPDGETASAADQIEQILTAWEARCADIRRIDSAFIRTTIDRKGRTECRGDGALAVDAAGNAEYRVDPVSFGRDEVSTVTEGGRPYRLKSDRAECWHWTKSHVLRIFEERKWAGIAAFRSEHDAGNLPPEFNAEPTRIWCRDFYLGRPFLLGMQRDELQKHFDVRLLDKTETDLVLALDRKPESASPPYRRARLTLSRKTYLPVVIDVDDLLGRSSTVRHVLRDVSVNMPPDSAKDIEAPDFGGFKWLTVPNALEVVP